MILLILPGRKPHRSVVHLWWRRTRALRTTPALWAPCGAPRWGLTARAALPAAHAPSREVRPPSISNRNPLCEHTSCVCVCGGAGGWVWKESSVALKAPYDFKGSSLIWRGLMEHSQSSESHWGSTYVPYGLYDTMLLSSYCQQWFNQSYLIVLMLIVIGTWWWWWWS